MKCILLLLGIGGLSIRIRSDDFSTQPRAYEGAVFLFISRKA